MKWIVLIKLILEIISKLDSQIIANSSDAEATVRGIVRGCVETLLGTPGEASAKFGDWEELIEHIVAIVLFFLRRNIPQV
jgi:hypothetical protein